MLNPKQQAFADQYLVDKNATKAAISAGYSQKSAARIGWKLLNYDIRIKAYILEKTQSIADKLGITAEYALRGVKQVADMSLPDHHKADPVAALKALDYLGKHLKLWDNDDKKSQGGITVNIVQF